MTAPGRLGSHERSARGHSRSLTRHVVNEFPGPHGATSPKAPLSGFGATWERVPVVDAGVSTVVEYVRDATGRVVLG